MALGSTQPLVKMSTRNIPGGKGGQCVRLTTYQNIVLLSRNLGALTSQNPLGLFGPVTGLLYILQEGYLGGLCTRVGTLIVATIYLQLIQNRYMFRSFTVLQCSHQHCLQPVASDVEVVGYL